MKDALLILCTISGTVYAQLVFKWQAKSIKLGKISSAADLLPTITCMFRPWMLSAFAAMFAGTICWMVVIRSMPLTRAYMFVGLTFVSVMLGGSLVFNEQLTAGRLIGCALIVAGVIVGGRG